MKMPSWISLVAGLITIPCLGCSSPIKQLKNPFNPTHGLIISHEFSTLQTTEILNAATKWQNSSTKIVSFVITTNPISNETIFVELLTSSDPRLQGAFFTARGLGIHNPCSISYARIVSDRIHTLKLFKLIVMHEIGHAIGLHHVNSRGSIMHKNIVDCTSTCPTYDDMKEFCEKFNCNVNLMKHCKSTCIK